MKLTGSVFRGSAAFVALLHLADNGARYIEGFCAEMGQEPNNFSQGLTRLRNEGYVQIFWRPGDAKQQRMRRIAATPAGLRALEAAENRPAQRHQRQAEHA